MPGQGHPASKHGNISGPPPRGVDVFDYDVTTGALTGRRTFADTSTIPGIPDGLTLDAEGGVWVAFYGGGRVCRFAPEGIST